MDNKKTKELKKEVKYMHNTIKSHSKKISLHRFVLIILIMLAIVYIVNAKKITNDNQQVITNYNLENEWS